MKTKSSSKQDIISLYNAGIISSDSAISFGINSDNLDLTYSDNPEGQKRNESRIEAADTVKDIPILTSLLMLLKIN